MSPATNSLDLLRLTAAVMVLYSHQFSLVGLPEPSFLGLQSFGGAGVTIFFFLSGMLVWQSWVNDPDVRRFMVRRSLRIFPALLFVVLVTALVAGPLLSGLSWGNYFASESTWRYLGNAIFLRSQVLPGVFVSNPYPGIVNGSLWTLPVEFFCYVMVAALGSFRFREGWDLQGFVLLGAVGLCEALAIFTDSRFLIHLEMVCAFCFGTFFARCRADWKAGKVIPRSLWLPGLAAVLVLIAVGPRGVERAAMLCLAAAIVLIAYENAWGSFWTQRTGDLSYGVYIFAFPVQQAVIQWAQRSGTGSDNLIWMSLSITLCLAYVSWRWVERPALSFKPRREVIA